MRILLVADIESKYYWDFFEKSKLEGIDLILSAGDLSPHYLEFLATYATAPVLYVHGNHDECYDETPPGGCECIDDTVYDFHGLRIMGLGGSMSYNMGTYQFTERKMWMRYEKLRPKIMLHRGIDILLTHAPARGLNDLEDLPHMGFECFNTILDRYEPKLFIHGHVHMNYGRNMKREDTYRSTRVINAYERYIIDI